ncbi:minichromosome maintenance complex-binding protein [Tanacetum coccineum]
MVGRQYDCLTNPLGAVRFTFDKAVASGSDPASLDRKDWGVADIFRDFLFDNDGLSQVPILTPSTLHVIQPNSLVRFRGMIQDMLGNEFYVGAYKNEETWNTNKFSDVAQFPMGPSPDMRVWERRLLYCVPVPGQNTWADSASEGVISTYATSANREKRQRDTCSVSDEMDIQESSNEMPNSPCAKKMREGESVPLENMMDTTDCGTSVVPEFDRNNFPCLVKIYDTPESDLKLNDVLEFIGVLAFDTDVKDDKRGENEMANCFDEEESVSLPSSKVPRLHCLVHRKLSVNDLISSSPTMEPKPHLLRGIRESLLRHLTVVLGDDELAAHFMLLHLLSKVHLRVDSVAVGKLSLNLSGFDKSSISIFGIRINDAVKNLLPYSQRMPLTVDYLNTASLAPVKDYETNRLVPGALQCAEGSHLTVDETPLQSGTLNNNGVENARVLKDLLDFQKIDGTMVGPLENIDSETLDAWRWYLATLRSLTYSIGTEIQKVVEDDMVSARQVDRSLGTEDFNRWLTMGRLMSVSFGETCLSNEHWQMVKKWKG